MLKGWMQRLSGVFARSIGGRVLRAGDQAFADKLFWAKYRFRDLRANYYYDLAMRIEHMPGEPISNHFAKDAARRAGEPIGMLASHWLARYEGVDGQMQHSRLTAVFRGTVPEEDIPILAVSEEGGDIKEGLLTLAKNLIALQAAKAGVIATLASVIAVLLILHVYLGVMAFVVGPQVDRSFASTLSVDDYGPLAAGYHVSTTWLRHWGWLVLLAELALVAWVIRALPGYVGRWRNWLDSKVLVFDFFRRFQSAQFLAGMSAVTKRFGADARNLAQGLSLMRTNAYPYLGHHIERMELNLEYIPNEGGKIFDTGLFDRDTSYRIQDIAEYEGDLSRMLQTVSEHLLERAPKEMLARATRFNRRASVLLIVLMTGLAYYPAFMAQELNAKSKLAAMSNKRPVQTIPQHQ